MANSVSGKIAIGIEYDGSDFCGWQSQRGGQTVQDALTAALSAVADSPVVVHAAGRTDAGVHASLMIAHFNAPVERSLVSWVTGTNSRLSTAVRVLWAMSVTEDFHARHCALARHYRYILQNRPSAPALLRRYAGFCPYSLDVEAMQAASLHVLGERDFSAFRAAACQAKTPVRRLTLLKIKQCDEWVVFDFRGNGFLHHMIRNIVGALVWVGRGRRPPEWIIELLAGADRRVSPPTAAAAGLYFCGVRYAVHFNISEQYRVPNISVSKNATML